MGFLSVKPGGLLSDTIDIGTWYEFTEPGTYTVSVRRRAWRAQEDVTSNAITITIVPAQGHSQAAVPEELVGSQPPFSLELWVSPRVVTFPAGGVAFEVVTENTSKHKIFLATELPAKEQSGSVYKVDVHDSAGATPPASEFGRLTDISGDAPPAPRTGPRQAGECLRLLPGEKWYDTIHLGAVYNLTKPGQYTVQARRWDDETKTWVKSNTITVTVAPSEHQWRVASG